MAVKPFIKVLIFVFSALFAAYFFREFVISRESAQITQFSRLIKWQMDADIPKKVEDADKIKLIKDKKTNKEEKKEGKKEGKKEEKKEEKKKEERKEEKKEEKKE
uniref:Uncharacterized protein n=1 Tax=Meloidogyne javanica TaxID=6303 RepID=A0A915M3I9_MELJA